MPSERKVNVSPRKINYAGWIIGTVGISIALASTSVFIDWHSSPEGQAAVQAKQEAAQRAFDGWVAVAARRAVWTPGLNGVLIPCVTECVRGADARTIMLRVAEEVFRRDAPAGATAISNVLLGVGYASVDGIMVTYKVPGQGP